MSSNDHKNFNDKMSDALDSIRNKRDENKKSVETPVSKMKADNMEWAKSTISLRREPSFASYISKEAMLIAESLQFAFEKRFYIECTGDTSASFDDIMKFNRGFHFGVKYMKFMREQLWLDYLNQHNPKEKKHEDEKSKKAK